MCIAVVVAWYTQYVSCILHTLSSLYVHTNYQGEQDKQRVELERLERELRETKLDSDKRVSDTAQFQQMMKLMKSQVRACMYIICLSE